MGSGDQRKHNGLSSAEAARRLARDGPNALSGEGTRTLLLIFVDALREPLLLLIFVDALREPLLLLIFVAGILSLAVGDFHEAILLAALGTLNIGLVVYQEHKTERILESLRDLSSPHATVIRDGVPKRIPAAEIVRGDVLAVAEGDSIAADGKSWSARDWLRTNPR